eukprot:CAMPEP_0201725740 /NCGR_PEP_ID=MMETSP0593-20130828/9047_1 /ASSEMBLY_ACC=CAM_ASM_000672 /TAXON_ID=267983 /ORGANISM="Skeletonema japonicum, Strain CCMP2506" /LENGTH=38 /DNA_ID= /DNA_START= /DNA_END= /DNA_ORIENTATION=
MSMVCTDHACLAPPSPPPSMFFEQSLRGILPEAEELAA